MTVQAQRVRRERDRAEAEAAKAGAINSFLLDALGAVDPWSKGSRNVSLLDTPRQAQGKAKTALGEQPLVEASVLHTIGTTFSNLAGFPEAENALKGSLALRVKVSGPRSGEAAERTYREAITLLTDLYTAWRKPAQAAVYAARLKPART